LKLRNFAGLVGIVLVVGSVARAGIAAPAEPAKKPAISEAARTALAHMGETLRAKEFAFAAHTIRVYVGKQGEQLHIFHALQVTVRRPNRLLVTRNGDDGASKLVYDGKTLFVYVADGNKYARIPVPDTISGMMREAIGRLGVDFPLADFLTGSPDKAFLSGVVSGTVVNTVTIDGVSCLHLFFTQPPDIELELWLENNEQALPRRLIVTYRSLPGQPNFAATFSNWDFSIHPTDAEFAFQPPPGAVKITLPTPAGTKKKGGK
jgi:hypothetical protein